MIEFPYGLRADCAGRVRDLLKRRSLGTEPFKDESPCYSNCHGTVAYVLGIESGLKRMATDAEQIATANGRPGYVGRDLMRDFLESQAIPIETDARPGDIAVIWANIHRAEPNVQNARRVLESLREPPIITYDHTAILVNPASEQMFHQANTGEEFDFSTMDQHFIDAYRGTMRRGLTHFVKYFRLR